MAVPDENPGKNNSLIALLLGLIGVPFLITLLKLFKKGADAPVTMSDLMAVFGVQVMLAVLLLIYLKFFHHATVVLG